MSSESNDTVMNATTLSYPYSKAWSIFHWQVFVWLFPTMCLTGGLLNLSCFWVILRHRRLFPKMTRQFMLIISLNDALILLLKAPTHYLSYMSKEFVDNGWTWFENPFHKTDATCYLYVFVTHYALFGAPFYQLGLTVERLVAVATPFKARQLMSAWKRWTLIAGVTCMALLLPTMRTAAVRWRPGKCDSEDGSNFLRNVYVRFELFYGRVLLMLCMITGALIISVLLCRSTGRSAGRVDSKTGAIRRIRTLTRLTCLLALYNVIFLMCNLPWSLIQMLIFSHRLDLIPGNSLELLVRQLNTLMYVQCVLNVLVYFVGQSFRRKFFATFCTQRCGRSSVPPTDGKIFSINNAIPVNNCPMYYRPKPRHSTSGFRHVGDSTRY